MKPFTDREVKLWQEMADLTLAKCREHCAILGSCCSSGDCHCAKLYAESQGVTLDPPNDKGLYLDEHGACRVSPHLRPSCTLHQCKISSIGFDPGDPKWTKRYFALRQKLDRTLKGRT